MKATRFHQWLIIVALMGGMGVGVTSCKDSDKDDSTNNDAKSEMTEEELAQDPYGKQTDKAMTLLRIVGQLTDVTELPNQWESTTYEPTNGFVGDDGNPYSRTQSVSGAADAARRFNSLTGAGIDSTTTSYSWSYDGLGTMTYRLTGDATQVATVDVDLQQMPHLKRIVYARDLGMNGSWSGTPYYRLGDVIQDTEGSYWVCVRSAWAYNKKEESHWISTSKLPEKNLVYYNKGKDDELCLPTALGNSTVHMRNFVDFFYALLWPEEYANMQQMQQTQVKKGLGDIDYVYHSKYYLKNVRYFYTKNNIWPYIFKFDKEMIEYEALNDLKKRYTPLNLYYNGYVMAGLSSQTGCYMRSYSGDGWQKESSDKDDKRRFAKSGGKKFNIQDLADKGYGYSPATNTSTSSYAYVVRYKTGEQLAKDNGKGKYNKQMAIPGVSEIYRYNAQPELGLPADYLTQDVKPVTQSVADDEDYVYGNYFDLKNMIIDGSRVAKNDQVIGFMVLNRGMLITSAKLHVTAQRNGLGVTDEIDRGTTVNISQNKAEGFTYNWRPSSAGEYLIKAWVEQGKDTLSTSINITEPDRSSEKIKIETNIPEYIDADDLNSDESFQLIATNNNSYNIGAITYTVLVYEGDKLITNDQWPMIFSSKGDNETYYINLKTKTSCTRTIKVINGLFGSQNVDTVFVHTVGIEVPHTAVITCDNPYPLVGETQNFTIKVTSHGSQGDNSKFKLMFYDSVGGNEENQEFEPFGGKEGETKTYTWSHKVKNADTYYVRFYDGNAFRIGEYQGYSSDRYFDGSIDGIFWNINVWSYETFRVYYTVKSVLGRKGKVRLVDTSNGLFNAESETIDIKPGETYKGFFEFTAPLVEKRIGKQLYRVVLEDIAKEKQLGELQTINVFHKPAD